MQARKFNAKTEAMVLTALLTALVGVLSYFGGFIKIGGLASISLTLIPVVLGATWISPATGAWLGGVSAVVFFLTPDAAFWFNLSAFGTVVTVLVKGIAAGLVAGLVYRLLVKRGRYLAVVASAVICPVVNTGIFLLGCLVFFVDTVKEMAGASDMSVFAFLLIVFVGLNFIFELLTNILLSPALVRVLELCKRKR